MSTTTTASSLRVPPGDATELMARPTQAKPGFTSKKQPHGLPAREPAGRLAVITGYPAPANQLRASTD